MTDFYSAMKNMRSVVIHGPLLRREQVRPEPAVRSHGERGRVWH